MTLTTNSLKDHVYMCGVPNATLTESKPHIEQRETKAHLLQKLNILKGVVKKLEKKGDGLMDRKDLTEGTLN